LILAMTAQSGMSVITSRKTRQVIQPESAPFVCRAVAANLEELPQ
jgi:hypothetical protein